MASTAPRVLHRLRCEMRRHGLAAVVVLSQDDHNSEYPALRFQRRALLSGFTGSAGTAVITAVPVPRSMLPDAPNDAAAVAPDVATNDEAIEAAGEFENCGALVWADGRYWEQAAGQLHPGWALMKDMRGEVGNVTPDAWVARLLSSLEATDRSTQKPQPDSENNAAPARKVACDARTMSVAEWDKFSKRFSDAVGTDVLVSFDSLLDTPVDSQVATPSSRLTLVDQVLSEFDLLPPLPSTTIVAHPERFTGRSVATKLRDVSASMRSVGCDAVVVAALDDVAWLFNLRSCPMPEGWTTPVFYAYAIVARAPESDAITATLFVDLPTDPSVVGSSSLDWIRSLPNVSVTIDGVDQTTPFTRTDVGTNTPQNAEGSGEAVAVTVRPYAEFFGALAGPALQTARVSVEETVTSFAVLETLKSRRGGAVTKTKGIVAHLKCVKNDVELAGFRASHVRDGAALTQFLAWTEYEVLRRAGLQPCGDADGGSNQEDAASSAFPLPSSATGSRHRVITDRNSVGVSEVEADSVLTLFRAQQAHYRGKSFDTIVGSGADGAVIHKTSIDADTFISPTELLLVDSGAQYLDGTTDITRTVCFTSERAAWWAEYLRHQETTGTVSEEGSQHLHAQVKKDIEACRRAANIGGESPSAVLKDASGFREERRAYTLVLKGHIALNKLVFPAGILGQRLDSFARQALWQYGLDYVHGTSHGVGSHLCVHEGPMGIGAGAQNPATAAGLQRGMVVSNEPGFYVPGRYGIRIENIDEIVAAEPLRFHLFDHQQNSGGRSGDQVGANETDGQQGQGQQEQGQKPEAQEFLTLHSIALAPLCRELIEVVLLSPEETAWVDTYHARVRAEVGPLLCGDARAAAYLEWHTRPLLEK